MRRGIKFTFLGVGGPAFLLIASYIALVAISYFRFEAPLAEVTRGKQDFSRLEDARPAEVIVPVLEPTAATKQLAALIARPAAEGQKISIAGSQHSMG